MARFFRQQAVAYRKALRNSTATTIEERAVLFAVATKDVDTKKLTHQLELAMIAGWLFGLRTYKFGNTTVPKNAVTKPLARDLTQAVMLGIAQTTQTDVFTALATPPVDQSIGALFVGYETTRAKLIAVTEANRSYQTGIHSAVLARFPNAITTIEKYWLPVDDACSICVANSAENYIAFDMAFSSGDQYPPAHPNCCCSALYRLIP